MAARRLIAVLIVLLVFSTLAAALLPNPRTGSTGETSSTTTTTKTQTTEAGPRGRLVRATIDAAEARPEQIVLAEGDQLELRVRSTRTDQVEVVGFGEVADVDRFAPARFNLLATHRGSYPVRLLDAHRTVGRILVRGRPASDERPG